MPSRRLEVFMPSSSVNSTKTALITGIIGQDGSYIATDRQESVRRFIELAAFELGWGFIHSQREGLEGTVLRADTENVVAHIDLRSFRLAEVEALLGYPTRVKEKLGWNRTPTLAELVAEMVALDGDEAQKQAYLRPMCLAVVDLIKNSPINFKVIQPAGGVS